MLRGENRCCSGCTSCSTPRKKNAELASCAGPWQVAPCAGLPASKGVVKAETEKEWATYTWVLHKSQRNDPLTHGSHINHRRAREENFLNLPYASPFIFYIYNLPLYRESASLYISAAAGLLFSLVPPRRRLPIPLRVDRSVGAIASSPSYVGKPSEASRSLVHLSPGGGSGGDRTTTTPILRYAPAFPWSCSNWGHWSWWLVGLVRGSYIFGCCVFFFGSLGFHRLNYWWGGQC